MINTQNQTPGGSDNQGISPLKWMRAYCEAFEQLANARLTQYEFAIAAVILKASLGAERLAAVVPSLHCFEQATGIPVPHVCDTVQALVTKRIIAVDPPGKRIEGTKRYAINPNFFSWGLKQRRLKKASNLPAVLEQLRLEYDEWVKKNGPLADALLYNFVEKQSGYALEITAGLAVGSAAKIDSGTDLRGGPKPPPFTERPAGQTACGNNDEARREVSAFSDGSEGRPATAATHRADVQQTLPGAASPKKTSFPTAAQLKSATPLEKSSFAWAWLEEVDQAGEVQKLSDPKCRHQWEKLCLANSYYVLTWLPSCLKRRMARRDEPPLTNPIAYLSRIALVDKKLTPLKELSLQRPPDSAVTGGGQNWRNYAPAVITESVIVSELRLPKV